MAAQMGSSAGTTAPARVLSAQIFSGAAGFSFTSDASHDSANVQTTAAPVFSFSGAFGLGNSASDTAAVGTCGAMFGATLAGKDELSTIAPQTPQLLSHWGSTSSSVSSGVSGGLFITRKRREEEEEKRREIAWMEVQARIQAKAGTSSASTQPGSESASASSTFSFEPEAASISATSSSVVGNPANSFRMETAGFPSGFASRKNMPVFAKGPLPAQKAVKGSLLAAAAAGVTMKLHLTNSDPLLVLAKEESPWPQHSASEAAVGATDEELGAALLSLISGELPVQSALFQRAFPAALLLHMVNQFLCDNDTLSLAHTAWSILRALKPYEWKTRILHFCLPLTESEFAVPPEETRFSFGRSRLAYLSIRSSVTCFEYPRGVDCSKVRIPPTVRELWLGSSMEERGAQMDLETLTLPQHGLQTLRLAPDSHTRNSSYQLINRTWPSTLTEFSVGPSWTGELPLALLANSNLQKMLIHGQGPLPVFPNYLWPNTLNHLELPNFPLGLKLSDLNLPPSLKFLQLRSRLAFFHVGSAGAKDGLPMGLETLSLPCGNLPHLFQTSFAHDWLPKGLVSLTVASPLQLESAMDLSLSDLPQTLRTLVCSDPSHPNSALDNVFSHPNLTELELPPAFNHPITRLPPNLKKLVLSSTWCHEFNFPWPDQLQSLTIPSYRFELRADDLPSSLTELKFGQDNMAAQRREFTNLPNLTKLDISELEMAPEHLSECGVHEDPFRYPEALVELCLPLYNIFPRSIHLPPALTRLSVPSSFPSGGDIESVNLPPGLKSLRVVDNGAHTDLGLMQLPHTLEELDISTVGKGRYKAAIGSIRLPSGLTRLMLPALQLRNFPRVSPHNIRKPLVLPRNLELLSWSYVDDDGQPGEVFDLLENTHLPPGLKLQCFGKPVLPRSKQ
jgi:hypothetical protein